jgi:hypothetical protein
MLAKTKQPPLTFVERYLEIHGCKEGQRVFQTDQGGELYGSFTFCQVIEKSKYLLKPAAQMQLFKMHVQNVQIEC